MFHHLCFSQGQNGAAISESEKRKEAHQPLQAPSMRSQDRRQGMCGTNREILMAQVANLVLFQRFHL